MELFQFTRKFYQTLGIYSLRLKRTYSFNWRIGLIYVSTILIFISLFGFMRFEAQSVMDVGNCFFGIITQLNMSWEFITSIYQMPQILKYIADSNALIRKSKWNWNENDCIAKSVIYFSFNSNRNGKDLWNETEYECANCLRGFDR